jgi:hypothetical protein
MELIVVVTSWYIFLIFVLDPHFDGDTREGFFSRVSFPLRFPHLLHPFLFLKKHPIIPLLGLALRSLPT